MGKVEDGQRCILWLVFAAETRYIGINKYDESISMRNIRCIGTDKTKNMHKQLLLVARKQTLGTEVARVFECDMGELTGYIFGEGNPKSVYIPNMKVEHIAIHTHPSSSTLSSKDLLRFAQRDNLKMLTVIGHDGHIYAIEKTDGVEKELFMKKVHDISAATKVILGSNKTDDEKLVEINAIIRESQKMITPRR